MTTKNFKAFLQMVLQACYYGTAKAMVEAKYTNGNTCYLAPPLEQNVFPRTVASTLATNGYGGISVGRGNRPATEDDYRLEDKITTGLTAESPTKTSGVDSDGNPYLEYQFLLSNTTGADIVIKEVGYGQSVYCGNTAGATSISTYSILFDRTVLENPLTVPANGTAVLKYTLKTIINTPSVS